MSEDTFKISSFRFDDPQEIELMYAQFKKSDKFANSYNTKIIHEKKEKWWNPSEMVVDAIYKLGATAGDKVIVTRKEGKKGSFTEVSLPGGIETQKQNLKPSNDRPMTPRSTHSMPDDHPIPMEAYTQPKSFKEPVFSDEKPDWDKINWAKCKTLMAAEAFAKGRELNAETMMECEKWADYCMKTERTSLPF